MSTLSVLAFFVIFAGGALAYGAIERRFARFLPGARRRRGDASTVRRCARPLTPPLEFPRWSEKAARLFLAGGCARFNDQTIQRVKEQG